jgi:hypothetical protein
MALIAHSFVMTGRIEEGGNLQCSYHGWVFDGAAKCLEIPQAEKEGPQAKVRAGGRDSTYFRAACSFGVSCQLLFWSVFNIRHLIQ